MYGVPKHHWFILKVACAVAVLVLILVGMSKSAYSETPSSFTLDTPDLTQIPVDTEVHDLQFVLMHTDGDLDSPQSKIRVAVTNQPEGSAVEFNQQNGDGSFYNVIDDDYSPNNSFVIPAGKDRRDLFTVKFSMKGEYTIRYSLIDLDESKRDILDVTVPIFVVDAPTPPVENVPDADGNATVDDAHPEVVVRSSSQPITITVSTSTSTPTISFNHLVSGGAGLLPQMTINSGLASVIFAASTTATSSDSSWDGVMNLPAVTTATLPNGDNLVTALDLGAAEKLSFDRGVRINIFGQAGKQAGYVRNNTFTEITDACASNDQTTGDALAVDGDCKIDSGSDLVIWTKHFTTFVTFTSTTTPALPAPDQTQTGQHDGNATTTSTSTPDSASTTTPDASGPTSTSTPSDTSTTTPPSDSGSSTSTPPQSDQSDASGTPPSDQQANVFSAGSSFGILGWIGGIILLGGAFYVIFRRK